MITATLPKIIFDDGGVMQSIKNIIVETQAIIRKRTLSGKDANLVEFDKYSEPYKKYKQSVSKTGEIVQLQNTGTMLNSMDKRAIQGGFDVYISNDNRAMIGWIHNEGVGKMPKREWMGLNDADIAKLEQRYLGKREFIK